MNKPALTDSECSAIVLRWALDESAMASYASTKANIDEQCRQVAEKEWDRLNPDAGIGFATGNPYKPQTSYGAENRAKLADAAARWCAVRDFVVRRICSCIDDAPKPVSGTISRNPAALTPDSLFPPCS